MVDPNRHNEERNLPVEEPYLLVEKKGEGIKLKEPLTGSEKFDEDIHKLLCCNKSILSKYANSLQGLVDSLLDDLYKAEYKNARVDIYAYEEGIHIEILYNVDKNCSVYDVRFVAKLSENNFTVNIEPPKERYLLVEKEGEGIKLQAPLIGSERFDEDIHKLLCCNKSILSKYTNSLKGLVNSLLDDLYKAEYKYARVDIYAYEEGIHIEILYKVGKECSDCSGYIVRFVAELSENGFTVNIEYPTKTWRNMAANYLLYGVMGLVVFSAAIYLIRNKDRIIVMSEKVSEKIYEKIIEKGLEKVYKIFEKKVKTRSYKVKN